MSHNRDNKFVSLPISRPAPVPIPAPVIAPAPVAPIPLAYTCAARPPEYVDIRVLNTFGHDSEGFYWEACGKKYHSEIDFIRMLFTPKSMTWEEAIRVVK